MVAISTSDRFLRALERILQALALPMLAMLIPGKTWAQERCEPAAARVVSAQGSVELQRAGAAVWLAAALDEALCFGDTVRVGPASRAALVLANDALLRLDQRTTLTLRGSTEERRSLLNLIFGAVYFFSHQPRALAVDTPFVNAAAEGTEFLVRVAEDRAEVIMLDGQVLLQNAEGELRVARGDAAIVLAGAAPAPMIVARPRDAVAWALYYPPVLAALAERRARPRAPPPGLQTVIDAVAANDYPGALDALDAVPEAARDARYWTYRAGVLLNVGRVEEAQTAIGRALALDPEAGEALAQRAIIHVVQNREAEALADARRALELSPDSAPAAIALSYALQAAFQLEEAREVLRTAVERNPEDALAWARLAELEQMFGNLGASRDAAAQAVALAPDLARTQMVLGFAALTRIDIDGARVAFERAIELDSANPLPRLGLGLAKIRRSDLADGRHEIEIAAALDPNDALIRSYLGKAYFEEKRDPLDAEQFAIAKELDPNDPTPWFYDAIRLQTENRPVEALRNLERSIELNDNRAVFRSRLLLDQDLATRQTSLARIFNDLGFEQLGLNEATKSLSLDPANYSAHRFLSDTYAGLPRHEIARASELLQSQLLQPINLNPVQPSLPFNDLNIVTGAGPAANAFNEWTPLFTRDTAQLTATGLLGTEETLGTETVLTMLYDRVSVSAGGLLSETDGFRENNDVKNKVANTYAQIAVSPQFNVQAEYRYRDTDQGDLLLRFDPDAFSPFERRDIEDKSARVGAHYQPFPGSHFIGSVFYSDGSEHLADTTDEDVRITSDGNDEGVDAQGQYILSTNRVNLIAGGGAASIDVDLDFSLDFTDLIGIPCPPTAPFFGECTFSPRRSVDQQNVYLYANVAGPVDTELTLGASYDSVDQGPVGEDGFNPKLGFQWSPISSVRLRAAYIKTVKRALIADQTLEPTQVAGFNQFFDDLDVSKSERYGVGLDFQLSKDVYSGLELSRRNLDVPVTDLITEEVTTDDEHEDLYRAYLYWAINRRWSARTGISYGEFGLSEVFAVGQDFPRKLNELILPLSLNFFHPSGFFAELEGNYVYQDIKLEEDDSTQHESDDFFLVSTSVGVRLPKRRGLVSFEIVNLLDEKFHFQDVKVQRQQPRVPRFIPERTFLARLTLTF